MGKVWIFIFFVFSFFLISSKAYASHNCSDSLYDSAKAYKLQAIQCGLGDCREDLQCTGGRTGACQSTCWPPKISCINLIDEVSPLNPNVNEEVKLLLNPHTTSYTIDVFDSTSSSPTQPRRKGTLAADQNEFSLGTFPQPTHISILLYEHTLLGKVLCNGPTFFSFNVGGGSSSFTLPPLTGPIVAPFTPQPCAVGGNAGIQTALGCIATSPSGLVSSVLQILLGIAGAVAVLLIIYSGYRMMTSAGNPEVLQGARETLTSAIVGLLFIIFSLVLLEVIGADILRIPGFQK